MYTSEFEIKRLGQDMTISFDNATGKIVKVWFTRMSLVPVELSERAMDDLQEERAETISEIMAENKKHEEEYAEHIRHYSNGSHYI